MTTSSCCCCCCCCCINVVDCVGSPGGLCMSRSSCSSSRVVRGLLLLRIAGRGSRGVTVVPAIDGCDGGLRYDAFADGTFFVERVNMEPTVETRPTEEMSTTSHHGFIRFLEANVALKILSYTVVVAAAAGGQCVAGLLSTACRSDHRRHAERRRPSCSCSSRLLINLLLLLLAQYLSCFYLQKRWICRSSSCS